MSTFKFICPNCGQKILGDSSFSGTTLACPTCKRPLTVPRPDAATAAPVAPHSLASTIPLPGLAPGRPVPKRNSRVAIASVICAIFWPIGTIPAIICGHLALARIRQNPALKGEGIANVGLILSYIGLAIYLVRVVLKLVF